MIRVALSGGLGAGKSTVGQMLAARGAVVIDSDQVARDVLARGSRGERAVLERFGPPVERADGTLDRKALAKLVFADPALRTALEAITHPLIRKETERRIAEARASVVVVEIPLLDTARRRLYDFDAVVLVEAPEDIAVNRAGQRGIKPGDARARLACQPSPAERRAAADLVITNAGSLRELEAQVDDTLWPWLLRELASRSR